MKLRMLPAMLVLLPFFTVAQITLKGKVVDEQTLTPLQGAHLNLNNRLVHITTDEKGMFEINGLKAGNYQIKVSYMGYQVWESLVDLSADKVMLISMERSAIMSDATIITATRANEKTPVTYQDLNAEEISRKNQGRDI
ncbi:MAG TPA: hypothetical protein DCL86_11655, partial [Bacteroidales bacterium]|nr:hypothetical protein [Bacteroidales bacterium]